MKLCHKEMEQGHKVWVRKKVKGRVPVILLKGLSHNKARVEWDLVKVQGHAGAEDQGETRARAEELEDAGVTGNNKNNI